LKEDIATRWVKFLIFIPLVAIILNGCSTLSKNECLNADWHTIGYQDGYKGYSKPRIGRHRKACAEYGVKPVLKHYLTGYKDGLAEYCQPYRGYRRGLLGYKNKQLCKGKYRKPYFVAYMYGYDIYMLEQQIKENKESINYIVERNYTLEDKRVRLENKLINKRNTREQRRRLVKAIRRIENRKILNISAIRYHESLMGEIEREIEYLKSNQKF